MELIVIHVLQFRERLQMLPIDRKNLEYEIYRVDNYK